jgi:hypothetical protein
LYGILVDDPALPFASSAVEWPPALAATGEGFPARIELLGSKQVFNPSEQKENIKSQVAFPHHV